MLATLMRIRISIINQAVIQKRSQEIRNYGDSVDEFIKKNARKTMEIF